MLRVVFLILGLLAVGEAIKVLIAPSGQYHGEEDALLELPGSSILKLQITFEETKQELPNGTAVTVAFEKDDALMGNFGQLIVEEKRSSFDIELKTPEIFLCSNYDLVIRSWNRDHNGRIMYTRRVKIVGQHIIKVVSSSSNSEQTTLAYRFRSLQ